MVIHYSALSPPEDSPPPELLPPDSLPPPELLPPELLPPDSLPPPELLLPEPLPLYSASEIPALFDSPNKETEDALRGLQYARECDLRTPQEIEWKKAELSAAIRRAKADYDKSALDDALEEWRKLQDLQMSIFAMQYAAEWRTTRRGDERAR